jgi:hypothetical protein
MDQRFEEDLWKCFDDVAEPSQTMLMIVQGLSNKAADHASPRRTAIDISEPYFNFFYYFNCIHINSSPVCISQFTQIHDLFSIFRSASGI